MANHHDPESIEEVLECVEDAGNGDRRVSVSDIIEQIGDTAFAPLILVPALVIVTPASAIFGLPTVCGMVIVLVAFQRVIGREKLWLPGFIRERTVTKKRLDGIVHYLAKPARLVDAMTRKRLGFLVAPPLDRVWAGVCALLALGFPFLELVPMTSTILASAIALFALAILARDGLFVILGLAVLGGAGWLGWTMVV